MSGGGDFPYLPGYIFFSTSLDGGTARRHCGWSAKHHSEGRPAAAAIKKEEKGGPLCYFRGTMSEGLTYPPTFSPLLASSPLCISA